MFNNFILESRPKILFGKQQIVNLEKLLTNYNNILLVYGQNSIKKNGLYSEIIEILKFKNTYELEGITPNPKLSDVYKGIKICKNENIDFILAIGGGSVIDATKAISLGAKSTLDIWDIIINKRAVEGSLDFGTITTMIATGSEIQTISE